MMRLILRLLVLVLQWLMLMMKMLLVRFGAAVSCGNGQILLMLHLFPEIPASNAATIGAADVIMLLFLIMLLAYNTV